MPATNIKISMNEYMRLVNEDAEKAVNNPVYRSLLENLSALTNLTRRYFTADRYGNLPVLIDEDYERLSDSYTKLAKSCNDFLSADHKKNRLENKRLNMIKQLQNCVGKDLQSLVNADKTRAYTLSDVVKDARTRKVDLTGKKLGSVGGNLSTRIPLKTARGIKGFFTVKDVFNYEKEFKNSVNRYAEHLPEYLIDGFKEMDEDEILKENITSVLSLLSDKIDITNGTAQDVDKVYTTLADTLGDICPGKDKDEIKQELLENLDFAQNAVKLINELSGIQSKLDSYEVTGIPDGSRKDQRNSAMSDVASLMGMGKLLAKAIPMTIVHDGETIEGTFMETAEGEDITKLSLESTLMQADKDSFNNPALLKQAADMMILDYICGNTDRHQGNMLYHTAVDENGKTIVTGITGIDNDSSFGTRLFNDSEASMQLTKLQEIGVISQSCYETVMNMSPDALKVVLADKLSLEETEAAVKRLTNLQEELIKGKIKVVEDKQWGKDDLTLDNLILKGKIFDNIKSVSRNIEREKAEALEEQKHTKGIVYAEGKEITDLAPDNFSDIYKKIVEFDTKTNSLKGALHKDSKEYKDMLTALKDVKEYGRTISEKLAKGEDVSMDDYTTFAQKTAQLGFASQDYMDAKSLSQRTEFGQNRFAFAKEMRNLAQENFPVKELPEEPEAEKQPSEQMEL